MITLAQAPSSDQLLSGSAPAPTSTSAPGAAQQSSTTGTPLPPQSQNPGFGFLLPFILVIVFFVVVQFMASSREKKKRSTLMSSLKKGDKVLTIGGVIAHIAEVREDEIVLRVDENSNAKMRVVRSAIQQNLSSSTAAPQVEVKTKSDARESEKVTV